MPAAAADRRDDILKEAVTMIFLAVNSWLDLRSREISLLLTAVYGVGGILCSIFQRRQITDILIPAGIGMMFLAMGFLSREAIGAGDGWILATLGTMLSTEVYVRMLCMGLFLAAFWSGILLVVCKKSRKTEIPLVPFLAVGYIGAILI